METKKYICKCQREFDNSQSLNSHFKWCLIHRNGIPRVSHLKNKPSVLKGKKLEEFGKNPELTKKLRKDSLNDYYKHNDAVKHTDESKLKISLARIKYLESSKNIKWKSLVNGLKVQGEWELNVGNVLLEKYPNLKREKLRYFTFRHYTPDFKIDENTYVEVKGWLSKRDISKYKKVQLAYPNIKIYLIRDELGIGNYTKFINKKISLDDCEDLYQVINMHS